MRFRQKIQKLLRSKQVKYLKLVLSVVACLAFIVAVFFFRGDFMVRRIQEDMLSCNILEFDKGSSTYISRINDSSQVVFDDGKIKGFGALTSVQDGENTGGFTIEVQDMTEKPNGVLYATLSQDGKYLATISTSKELKIYKTSDNKILPFKEPIKILVTNPFSSSQASFPYVFWTNEGLVYNVRVQDEIVWGIKDKTVVFPRLYVPETMEHKLLTDSENLIQAIGKIDNKTMLLLETPRDVTLPKKLLVYRNGQTEQFDADASFFAFSQTPNPSFFYNEEGKIKIAKASNPKEKTDLPLSQIGDKQITADETANLRITSRGYLYFEVPASGKSYLIDPWSGVSVEVPDGKVPY